MKSNTENNRQLQRGKKDIYACHRHKNKNYHCKKVFKNSTYNCFIVVVSDNSHNMPVNF